jgi:Family of unknown function (DUF5995)
MPRMPAIPALAAALAPTPVFDVPGVLAVMHAIEAALPADDGVVAFGRLYRKTTENIAAALTNGAFAAPTWTTRLDVIFANYYFGALKLYLADSPDTPAPWLALFSRRAAQDVAPLQFAFAGMNAHIDRDLSFALEDLAVETGGWPAEGSPQRSDYLKVNDILAATEKEVKPSLEGALLAKVDWIFHGVDDALALYAVREVREAAWARGAAQFHLRGTKGEDVLDVLADGSSGLISRVLLAPTGKLKL